MKVIAKESVKPLRKCQPRAVGFVFMQLLLKIRIHFCALPEKCLAASFFHAFNDVGPSSRTAVHAELACVREADERVNFSYLFLSSRVLAQSTAMVPNQHLAPARAWATTPSMSRARRNKAPLTPAGR